MEQNRQHEKRIISRSIEPPFQAPHIRYDEARFGSLFIPYGRTINFFKIPRNIFFNIRLGNVNRAQDKGVGLHRIVHERADHQRFP
jgi:hypothetical protein